MAVNLSPVGGVAGQFFDNNGVPLAGGKIYTYASGTTTNQATYTSAAGAIAHTNPIILDGGGRVPSGEIWLTDGLQYKFVLKNASDVLIGTYDNIIGINSNFVNFLTETEVQTATAGQTIFTLATMQYQPGTNNLSVFVDGVNQIDGSSYSYVETSSTVVTFTAGLHVGALVKFTTAQTLSTGVTDASLVTYDPPFANGVETTVELKLAQTVSAKDFGAVGDGVTDDTLALQAWANCGVKNLHWNEGKYLVSASLAQALDVNVFNFGDAALKACILFPAGVNVTTAGTATQLIVNSPDVTTCGIAINADAGGSPTTHSQIATQIERFILRSNGANGRYGVVTPAAALLLADKRPRYALDVQFAPPPGSDNQTICSYGWDVGIMLGDTVDARVFYAGYGTYNTTLPDAGQHQMVGMKVKAVVGAYGVVVQYQCSNMRTFFEGSDGLEGFVVRDSEGQGCWYGVALTSAGVEPGGYIDNVHTNANKTAYLLSNRSSLQIGMVEAYRSDAYDNHGGEWNGIAMDACGKVTINSLHTIHGTLLTKTGTNAIKATGTSTFICSAMQTNSVANAVYIDSSPDCIVGNQIVNSIDTLFNLNGASTNDFTGGAVMVRAGAPVYLVTNGTVDKKRIRLPLNSGIAVRTYQTITIAAAGSTTVKPRETATTFNIVMSIGTGPFTYDLILDRTAAVVGDVVTVHVNGSASANPTLRVCDNSTAVVLDTFNNITGTGRYLAQYIFQESGVSGTWVTLGLMQSVELSF